MINSHRRFGEGCRPHLQGSAVNDKESQGAPQSGQTTEVCIARPQAVTAVVTQTDGFWNDTPRLVGQCHHSVTHKVRHNDPLKPVDTA
jgi:hypothetical protein